VVVETGEELETIGLFPSVAADGAVAFAATLHNGGGGVFVARDGMIVAIQTDGAFESYRGALVCDAGVVRIATPIGGTLGLFAGPDPEVDRILAIGDPLFGSTVEEFAANPVSVNAVGRLAVRLTLADGRGLIVRCDPFGAPSSAVRHAARIVMVDADERVLLFGFRDPTTGNEFWATTGGGIEPGESALVAARREYREETGHEGPDDLGPVVWHRTTGFEWDGAWMRADEVFFYQRVDRLAVSEAHVETLQVEGVIGHRWLSLDELRASDLEVYPVGLADLVADLLANGPPAEPIELRESSGEQREVSDERT
jgi:8-oxo-dGTP pyrophosphatase MutT (NUDIX family)